MVPGPGLPPPELLVLLVVPLDPPPLDDVLPELDDELASPLEDDALLGAGSSLPPHATTIAIPKTRTTPLMVRS
jgi:hypothetical protein